jgi:hypothetical protein
MIKAHLALVFKHEIDPSMGGPDHQAALNEIHAQSKAAKQTAEEALKEAKKPHGPGTPTVYRC